MGELEAEPSTRRTLLVDIGAFLLALIVGFFSFASEMAGTTTSHADAAASGDSYISPVLVVADLIAGLICCAAVWFRRRWPVGVALGIAPATVFSAMAPGPALVAIFGLAVRRPARFVVPVVGVYLALLPVYILVRTEASWSDAFAVPLILGAVVGWGMYVRSRRELMRSFAERAERAEAEQRLRVDQARRAERARIAREMHDVLAHRLSLLSLHAGALEYGASTSPEAAAHAATVIRDSAHEALEELRAVIGVLRADGLAESEAPEPPQPTLAQLQGLIEESRDAGMHLAAELHVNDAGSVPPAVGRHAYRIVQEGLTNARKHAHGCAVELRVEGAAGEGLEIEVRNRLPVGSGRGSPAGAGAGLPGLTERAAIAGGRLEHGTVDGDFRLWAWLPWPP